MKETRIAKKEKKKCTKCKLNKEINCFYIRKDNGKLRSWCKDCIINERKKTITEYCRKLRENDKYRKELNEKSRKWRIENKDYYKSYDKRNTLLVKARRLAKKIPLKKRCEICKGKESLERHHWDYNKPLVVVTLCKRCHSIIHHKNKIYDEAGV